MLNIQLILQLNTKIPYKIYKTYIYNIKNIYIENILKQKLKIKIKKYKNYQKNCNIFYEKQRRGS